MRDSAEEIRYEIVHRPRLSRAELAAMVEIERACYPPKTRYSLASIKTFVGMRGGLLARAMAGDGRLAGFQISNIASGHLVTLDVHPDFQRRGIGSAILARTLEEFRRHHLPAAQCEIAINNFPSIRLHARFGFVAVGIVEDYYEDHSDAAVMLLPLGRAGAPD